jgi:hypothetical protein
MLNLRVPVTINALGERLLNLLKVSEADNELMIGKNAGAIEPVVNTLSLSEARTLFRWRLQDRLYRSEALVRTRLKLVLARFCMVCFLLEICALRLVTQLSIRPEGFPVIEPRSITSVFTTSHCP